jgi:hypothetical protein
MPDDLVGGIHEVINARERHVPIYNTIEELQLLSKIQTFSKALTHFAQRFGPMKKAGR